MLPNLIQIDLKGNLVDDLSQLNNLKYCKKLNKVVFQSTDGKDENPICHNTEYLNTIKVFHNK